MKNLFDYPSLAPYFSYLGKCWSNTYVENGKLQCVD